MLLLAANLIISLVDPKHFDRWRFNHVGAAGMTGDTVNILDSMKMGAL
jgi:hypothetical protein